MKKLALAATLLALFGVIACTPTEHRATGDIKPAGTMAPPATAPADHTPTFDIPKLDAIVIDGHPDDWHDQGFRVDLMAALDGKLKPAADLDARFRLAWNDRGLLVLFTVHDDDFLEDDTLDNIWQKDCVELYLADRRGGKQLIQPLIAPGMDPKFPELRYTIGDHRKDETLKKTKPTLQAARTKIEGGYILEVLLPWENVGVKPAPGTEVGFTAFVDDADKSQRQVNTLWYPGTGISADTSKMYSLRLSDHASPPVRAAARASLNGLKYSQASVVAAPELVGKEITLAADGQEIARGTLLKDGPMASAKLLAPFPPYGREWKTFEVRLDGTVLESIPVSDVAADRKKAALRADVRFRPYCFVGTQLPPCAFLDPVEAQNILGPHTLKVTYYDADFHEVTKALQRGRYGAIVEIQRPDAPTLKRYHTLFRAGDEDEVQNFRMPTAILSGQQMGVSEAIIAEQALPLASFLCNPNPSRPGEDDSASNAIIMSWLREIPPHLATTRRTDPWSRNLAWTHELKRHTGNLTPLRYIVQLPPGVEPTQTAKLPTIIMLHGSDATRREDYEWVGKNPLTTALKAKNDSRFIVVSPHAGAWLGWQAPSLDDLYQEILAKYPVDPDRVYLTGLSMGGYGSWMWAIEHPDRFAAVVPICGAGDPRDVLRLKDLPIWVFHGDKDPAVPVQKSYEMVEALRNINARVRLTIFPGVGHGSWDPAYATDGLFDWMLQQVRAHPAQPSTTLTGHAPSN